ncbi:GlcG/HbpS family heme-binding protein [Streptomyces sp. KLOTTS4A1]|uniref:GlcG/HbpS family heme-binding protein n=1 Tax=Streptomyces sp. KLOTTS4A1 TaxID=3390996 RepID=UPI0039F4973D
MKHVKQAFRRTRVMTGGALAVAIAAGGIGVYSAGASTDEAPAVVAAAAEGNVMQSDHLMIEAAQEAAEAALEEAAKQNQRVTVAIVDRDGNTVLTLRGDGAGPQSYESAVKKAFTAVSWNAPTSELVKRLENAPDLKDIPGTLFLAGGAPATVDGAPVAGIGVTGAPSGAIDEEIAQAGIAALSE